MPLSVPHIEVTFGTDANGTLQVMALDKGSGRSKAIAVSVEAGRLPA